MLLVQPTLEQKAFIGNALGENSHNIQNEIEILKKWLKEQPHLPDTWGTITINRDAHIT